MVALPLITVGVQELCVRGLSLAAFGVRNDVVGLSILYPQNFLATV